MGRDSMSNAAGRTALITSAMLVGGMRLWLQLRGKATTPFNEWAIGWGATFFILSLMAEVTAEGAGALSLIIAVSDFLKNGVALTTDISNVVTGTEGGSTFVASPFSATATDTANSTTSGKTAKKAATVNAK